MRIDHECIFCRIVRDEIPSQRVFEDEAVVAFRDVQPAAPVHILVVPREHIRSISDLGDDDGPVAAAMMLAARQIAVQEGLAERGYRVVVNTGEWGGQTVDHLHLHVLGGRQLRALG
ncbi:MAG: histidine triad nucleotide-binding protein [Vicinamibacterales bacterium]